MLLSLLLLGLVAFLSWFGWHYWSRYGDERADRIAYTGARRGRVVVCGASIAGLVMARALAPFCEEVVVLEKDELADFSAERAEQSRSGVPQARQSHLLLMRGLQIMDQLFGGHFSSEVLRCAGEKFDLCSEMPWQFFGGWMKRTQPGKGLPASVASSRFGFEQTLRRLLARDPSTRILSGVRKLEPVFVQPDPRQRARVTGVRYSTGKGAEAAEHTLDCDLLVDASGRNSHIVAWLEQMHVQGADANVWVDAKISYTSWVTERRGEKQLPMPAPDGANLPWRGFAVYEDHPKGLNKHAVCWPIEGDRYQLALGGMGGDPCPTDWEQACEYARGCSHPCVRDFMLTATPCHWGLPGEREQAESPERVRGTQYIVPASRKRALEKMANFPEGLHVTGDAACAFNPVFGQGMSMACLYALLLQRTVKLALGASGVSSAEAHRAALQRAVDESRGRFWWTTFDAWSLTAGEDLRWSFCQTNSHPFWLAVYRVLQPVAAAFHRSNTHSAANYVRFQAIAQMQAAMLSLLRPACIGTIAYYALRRALFGDEAKSSSAAAVAPAQPDSHQCESSKKR